MTPNTQTQMLVAQAELTIRAIEASPANVTDALLAILLHREAERVRQWAKPC